MVPLATKWDRPDGGNRRAGSSDLARKLFRSAMRGQHTRSFCHRPAGTTSPAGRWLTSPGAIMRWVEAAQHRRERCGIDAAAANEVLASYGLGRKGDQ
jgi:hypothetical protein